MEHKEQQVPINEGTSIRVKEIFTEEFMYRGVVFQRMTKNSMWYLTYGNVIVNWGQYRHDLMQWVDTAIEQLNSEKK